MTRAEIERLLAKAKAHWLWPDTPPPLDDASELALWIEGVRSVAFLAGARHSEITDVEAHVLATALRAMLAREEAMREALDIIPATIRRRSDTIRFGYELHITKDQLDTIEAARHLAQGAPDHA